MKKYQTYLKIIITVVLLMGISSAECYWQQFVHYTMSAKLVPEESAVYGESTILYVNNSPDRLDRIYLNLYPLAFQEGSVKYREFLNRYGALGRAARFADGMEDLFHQFDVNDFSVTMRDGDKSRAYKIDDTVLETDLPRDLLPGDSLTITIAWKHVNGELFERAGKVGDQYNMAQWYPKPMVYDEEGWQINPFHVEGEFYGEFGTFDVTLDVPGNYILGATGVVTAGDPGWSTVTVDTSMKFSEWEKTLPDSVDGKSLPRRSATFHAENVHDFAWVASPTYVYEHGKWDNVDIHVLYNRKNAAKWSKHVVRRSIRAVDWLSTQIGRYPYPQVTVTDRQNGGGMEYPMLVMNGSDREGLIVHEVGHIWFYGILGNNEIDAAWLDEGFTSFQTAWYMEHYYPPYGIDFENSRYSDFQKKYGKFEPGSKSNQWWAIQYMMSGNNEPVEHRSYQFNSGSGYRNNVYTKAAVMLEELHQMLGDSVFLSGMQAYFQEWQLKHVDEKRFTSAMEKAAGQELDWFFDPWLHDTQVIDYAICSVKSKANDNSTWDVNVDLTNKGDRSYPIIVALISREGDTLRHRYEDHQWRFRNTLKIESPFKPKMVILDPDVATADIDFRNNFSRRMPNDWSFRLAPNNRYQPRAAYRADWFPLLDYHPVDGWLPGISLARNYFWSSSRLNLNYATESSRLYWRVKTNFGLPHRFPRTRFYLDAYDYGGHAWADVHATKNWESVYNVPPNHSLTGGVYISVAKDTSLTPYFEAGQNVVFYSAYGVSLGPIRAETSIGLAPAGWSDWSFSKLTATLTGRKSIRKFDVCGRIFAGAFFSSETQLSGQELFTINGAGAYDLYPLSFMRSEKSLYGSDFLFTRYHKPGDGNLRGLTGQAGPAVWRILTGNTEVSRLIYSGVFDLIVSLFNDGGILCTRDQTWSDGSLVAAGGIGLILDKSILDKPFTLRLDFPLWYFWDIPAFPINQLTDVVISFERGL